MFLQIIDKSIVKENYDPLKIIIKYEKILNSFVDLDDNDIHHQKMRDRYNILKLKNIKILEEDVAMFNYHLANIFMETLLGIPYDEFMKSVGLNFYEGETWYSLTYIFRSILYFNIKLSYNFAATWLKRFFGIDLRRGVNLMRQILNWILYFKETILGAFLIALVFYFIIKTIEKILGIGKQVIEIFEEEDKKNERIKNLKKDLPTKADIQKFIIKPEILKFYEDVGKDLYKNNVQENVETDFLKLYEKGVPIENRIVKNIDFKEFHKLKVEDQYQIFMNKMKNIYEK